MSGRPAVFLDRDGVLNRYLPGAYVRTPDELELLPGVGAAVARLNAGGWPVVVISNQQGVGKGLMDAADLETVTRALRAGLAAQGGRIDAIYYCTHLSADACDCRKPRPGMLLAAARDLRLDLTRSVFVGDTAGDAKAARAAGVGAFVLVLTGQLGREAADDPVRFPAPPDLIADDLGDAAAWIERRNAPAA